MTVTFMLGKGFLTEQIARGKRFEGLITLGCTADGINSVFRKPGRTVLRLL